MYRPIAILHNERGLMIGLRVFQWDKDKWTDIEDDIMVDEVLVKPKLSRVNSRVLDLRFSEIISFLGLFGFFSEEKFGATGITSLSNVLADGKVVNDTLVIFEKSRILRRNKFSDGKSYELHVVDVNGNIARYTEMDLRFLCNCANINIGEPPALISNDSWFICHQGIKYATDEFKDNLRTFMANCDLAGVQYEYHEHTGQLIYHTEKATALIVPDIVSEVQVSTGHNLETLRLPETCDLACVDSEIMELESPVNVVERFEFVTRANLRYLTLPKRVGNYRKDDEFSIGLRQLSIKSTFRLSVKDLPSDIDCIDQSDYILCNNLIKFAGKSNLNTVVLSRGRILTSFEAISSDSKNLKSISIVNPANVLTPVAMYFHVVPKWLSIRSHTCVDDLRLSVGISSGVLDLTECYLHRLSLKLAVDTLNLSLGVKLVVLLGKLFSEIVLCDKRNLSEKVLRVDDFGKVKTLPNQYYNFTMLECSRKSLEEVLQKFYWNDKKCLIVKCID